MAKEAVFKPNVRSALVRQAWHAMNLGEAYAWVVASVLGPRQRKENAQIFKERSVHEEQVSKMPEGERMLKKRA